MKTDLISQSPTTHDGHLAGEAFNEEQLRYQGTDVQESAIDAEQPIEPDGKLSSFSALTLQGENDRMDEEAEEGSRTRSASTLRILDNSVLNLQEE